MKVLIEKNNNKYKVYNDIKYIDFRWYNNAFMVTLLTKEDKRISINKKQVKNIEVIESKNENETEKEEIEIKD